MAHCFVRLEKEPYQKGSITLANPRLLIEVKLMETWIPYRILTRSPTIQHALERLPQLVKDVEGGVENARIKRLFQDVQIAEAKIEITRIWGLGHVET